MDFSDRAIIGICSSDMADSGPTLHSRITPLAPMGSRNRSGKYLPELEIWSKGPRMAARNRTAMARPSLLLPRWHRLLP